MSRDRVEVEQIEVVVFDKDGTLLDFDRTWSTAVGVALQQIEDRSVRNDAAQILGFNFESGLIAADSPFVAETVDETIARLDEVTDATAFVADMNRAAGSTMAPAEGAGSTLRGLKQRGVGLAVVTNDDEANTRSQLADLGWLGFFDAVIGYDSGHRPKPAGDGVAAAIAASGADPAHAMMVGDTQRDITAGLQAGATTVLIGADPSVAAGYQYHIRRLDELLELPGVRDSAGVRDSTGLRDLPGAASGG